METTPKTPFYKALAATLATLAQPNIEANEKAFTAWETRLESLLEMLPSGSGIDSGTELDPKSTPDKLIFKFSFHHMNGNGYYTKWTQHKAIVTPSLQHDFDLRVTGPTHDGIREYLGDLFQQVLTEDVDRYIKIN